MRTAFPIAITLALLSPAHARPHPIPTIGYSSIGDQWTVMPVFAVGRPVVRHSAPKVARRHHKHRPIHAHPRAIAAVVHHHKGRSGQSLAGFPAPLVAKANEIEHACGSRIISAFRPGARVAGTNRQSNHAIKKAIDMAGAPGCIYAHLHGWPGGYSTDYSAVRHVHISYNRAKEWHARFVHRGGGTRYAYHRRPHYASAARRQHHYARRWHHRHYAKG